MAGKTADDLVTAVYDFYLSQGYTPYGAAYMVGSLLQESNLDPDAVQPGGPGRGLAQWTSGKNSYAEMVKYNERFGRPANDFAGQLRFTVQQRTDLTKKFKAADTEAKAQAAAADFERFDPKQAGHRWDYAKKIVQNVAAKKPAGAGMGDHVKVQKGHTPDDLIADLKAKFTKKEPGAAGSACAAGKGDPKTGGKKDEKPKAKAPAAAPEGPQLNVSAKLLTPVGRSAPPAGGAAGP